MGPYQNIAITGSRQAGKSTLALWLLEELGLPAAGFQTFPYAQTQRGPLYALVELGSGESVPISHLTGDRIRGIPEAFEGFGTQVLCRSLEAPEPIVLLDEIGRFEKNSPRFLHGLFSVLDSPKTVIAVLKQEELPYIQAIRARTDTLLVDLDLCSRASARAMLTNCMQKP